MDVVMAMSGIVGGGVTRQLIVTSQHCCRLYNGEGGNWLELISEAMVVVNWSSSCMMKGMVVSEVDIRG